MSGGGRATVAVLPTRPDRERVFADVAEAMERAGWREHVTRGAAVALKPNLGWDKLVPGAISAPWVVEAVVRTIRDHVGSIALVESDQVVLDMERGFRISGLERVCREWDVRWVNMSRGEFVTVMNPDRTILKEVRLPAILTESELITLPVMKTHNKTTITGALKNQWGCLETLRHHYHLVLSDAITDVNAIVRPRFAVMDGTVALEGDGPKSGSPRDADVVLASADLVGLDATAARIMGFDPHRIDHLRRAADAGLGSLDPPVTGEVRPADPPFVPARHNAVSWLELVLRRSTLRRLAFHSPMFGVLCWGARRYYDLWDLTVGRRTRARFLASSPWAPQWRATAPPEGS